MTAQLLTSLDVFPPRKRVCLPRRGQPLPPETRAKISAALTLRPPPAEVQVILTLYRVMGSCRVAAKTGYHRTVVRRVLREAGVAMRAPGRPRGAQDAPHG